MYLSKIRLFNKMLDKLAGSSSVSTLVQEFVLFTAYSVIKRNMFGFFL